VSEANKQKYADFYTVEHYGQRMAAVFDELLSRRKLAGQVGDQQIGKCPFR